jgi:plasmid stabilization system protein ParE
VSEAHDIDWSPNAVRGLDEVLEYVAHALNPDEADRWCLKIVSRIETSPRFPRRARLVAELRRVGGASTVSSSLRRIESSSESLRRTVAILGVLEVEET